MKNNERGFTLVEILAAMTILFIVLISFFGIFTQSALFTRTNEDTLQATNLADRSMELIRTVGRIGDDEEKIKEILSISETCDLFSHEGCPIEDPLRIRLEAVSIEPSLEDLELVPLKLEIFHVERKNYSVATRHFFFKSLER